MVLIEPPAEPDVIILLLKVISSAACNVPFLISTSLTTPLTIPKSASLLTIKIPPSIIVLV